MSGAREDPRAAGVLVSEAREEILARIRTGLADVPDHERSADVDVSREYRRRAEEPRDRLVERFAERVADYRAEVRRVAAEDVGRAVNEACEAMGLRSVVVPPTLPDSWRPSGLELIEDHGLTARELDAIDGAVTGCAAAIAETGTLLLDGQAASGRRLITLVPDHHICVVPGEQVVGLVPEAVAALAPSVTQGGVPVTLVSGPSASSDIELSRVEGVHGPRHLLVLIAHGDHAE